MNPGDVGPNRGLKLAVQQGLAALFATMAERKTQVTVRMWKAMLMATLHSWRDTVVASTFQHAFRTALGAAPHEKAGELWAGETPATRIPRSEHVVRIIIAKGALEAECRRKVPLARPEIPDFPLGPGPPVPYTVHVPADRETLPVYRLLAARPAIGVSVTPGAPRCRRCQARGEARR